MHMCNTSCVLTFSRHLKLVCLCVMCLFWMWLVLTGPPLLFHVITVITVKRAGCWHLPGFSHCDMLSDTLWTQCSALRPFSCLAFSHKTPLSFSSLSLSGSFVSANLTACHPSHFISGNTYWLRPREQWIMFYSMSSRCRTFNMTKHNFWWAVRTCHTLDDKATR